jgi:ribosomal protein S18 acetylase RimI-like enzyme
MESTLDLQVLLPVDWPVLRAARLQALQDSPHAFMSRYEVEGNRSNAEWQRFVESATWVVAHAADRVIGLACSVSECSRPGVRYLESIWVDPAHRRRGVFSALLHKLADLGRHGGSTELLLWVLEDNHPARHAYQAAGFEPTGRRQFLPEIGRFELELRVAIRPSPGS